MILLVSPSKFHLPSANSSLFVAIKPKATQGLLISRGHHVV